MGEGELTDKQREELEKLREDNPNVEFIGP